MNPFSEEFYFEERTAKVNVGRDPFVRTSPSMGKMVRFLANVGPRSYGGTEAIFHSSSLTYAATNEILCAHH